MITYQNMTARADRRRRRKAIFATVVVHAAILAFFLAGNNSQLADKLPDTVKEMLGMEVSTPLPQDDVASVKP